MPRTTRPRSNRFRQSNRSTKRTRRTPIDSPDGGTQIETVTTTRGRRQSRTERREPISTGGTQTTVETADTGAPKRSTGRSLSPVKAGSQAGGVGLLEAEFLAALLLLILLLFADTSKTYADKVMSTMKRGTLLMLLFFVLALTAGVGPGMAKISKAIGGLVVVAILLTSPMTDVIGNLDKFFKADWAGTSEQGSDVGQANTPATGGQAPQSTPLGAASGAVSRITQIIESLGFGFIK